MFVHIKVRKAGVEEGGGDYRINNYNNIIIETFERILFLGNNARPSGHRTQWPGLTGRRSAH